eukprot:CAMPEP_0185777216 /NCGR_PEP_ID=MMETSP1174-20130828/88636_1 /TAXON_ID=35687 /ORGANISM="Dictyocha speculum, Strain CCMP1381" /LENGTH=70 /DNA_ID=CAMNT_0028465503 /DNA_START=232 /DNA_END=444 /DNA_ORIENTATION=+
MIARELHMKLVGLAATTPSMEDRIMLSNHRSRQASAQLSGHPLSRLSPSLHMLLFSPNLVSTPSPRGGRH